MGVKFGVTQTCYGRRWMDNLLLSFFI